MRDFLVDDDVDLYPPVGSREQKPVEAVLFIPGWRSAKVELRGQPPAIVVNHLIQPFNQYLTDQSRIQISR